MKKFSEVSYLPHPQPKPGMLTSIRDGVHWLRMPLPFELNHINLYLIEDNDTVVIVDTGLGTKETSDLWLSCLAQIGKPLSAVIVTHMHPDHVGQAGNLCEKYQVPLYMTLGEYYVARALRAGAQGASQWNDRQYLQQAGIDEAKIDKSLASNGGLASVVAPLPLAYRRLDSQTVLTIGGNEWRIIIGRGHSPEHASLYCESLNILISGDQVLPQITPNIGVYSTEPEANSLKFYLDTLVQFFDLPDDVWVLPAHRQPFQGLHVRVEQLIHHHQAHLVALNNACLESKTVVECLPVLFKRKLSGHNMFFAIAECLSHLHYLMYENKLSKTIDEHGVAHYIAKEHMPDAPAEWLEGEEQFVSV